MIKRKENLVSQKSQIKYKSQSHLPTELLIKKLKKKLEKKNVDFEKAVSDSRPTLDRKRSLKRYAEVSEKTSKEVAQLILRFMSFTTSLEYAEQMIFQDMGGDGVTFDKRAATMLATNVLKVEMTKLILKHFKTNKNEVDKIIALSIERYFLPASKRPQNPQDSNNPNNMPVENFKHWMDSLLDKYGDR